MKTPDALLLSKELTAKRFTMELYEGYCALSCPLVPSRACAVTQRYPALGRILCAKRADVTEVVLQGAAFMSGQWLPTLTSRLTKLSEWEITCEVGTTTRKTTLSRLLRDCFFLLLLFFAMMTMMQSWQRSGRWWQWRSDKVTVEHKREQDYNQCNKQRKSLM